MPRHSLLNIFALRKTLGLLGRASFHEGKQRFFSRVKLSAAISNQLIWCVEVLLNDFSRFETADDFRTDIGTTTDSRRIAKDLSRLLDRFNHLALAYRALLRNFGAQPRERTGTYQRARPGAKVFGAKVFSHHLTNVIIDVLPRNFYKLAIAILILEDFTRWILEEASDNAGNVMVFQLTLLLHS